MATCQVFLLCVGAQLSHEPLSACHGGELMGEMINIRDWIGSNTCTEVQAETLINEMSASAA